MTNKLSFFTPTTLDEAFIFTMGASVKLSNNPIGFFGTGLKYAIAITLRLGGKIAIQTNTHKYLFHTQEETLRGESITMIYCDKSDASGEGETMRCPMTADYGKTWEPWMALRELYSNTMDEGGEVVEGEYLLRKPVLADGGVKYSDPPKEYTLITVECAEIANEWQARDMLFLNKARTPIWKNSTLEVYLGRSTSVFYRGINVAASPMPSGLTYNILAHATLTENRTLDSHMLGRHIILGMEMCNDANVLSAFFNATCKEGSRERSFTFYEHDTGNTPEYMDELIKVVKQRGDEVPTALMTIYYNKMKEESPLTVYKPASLANEQQSRFDACINQMANAGFVFRRYEFEFSYDMPEHHAAIVNFRHRVIILNPRLTLSHDDWEQQTMLTLIEEYAHTVDEAADRSRELQHTYNKMIYDLIKR